MGKYGYIRLAGGVLALAFIVAGIVALASGNGWLMTKNAVCALAFAYFAKGD